MMCQSRFITYNECAILVGDADNKGGYTCVQVIWEIYISVPFPQFYCDPNTALKKNYCNLKKNQKETILLHVKIIWNLNVRVHSKVLLEHTQNEARSLPSRS